MQREKCSKARRNEAFIRLTSATALSAFLVSSVIPPAIVTRAVDKAEAVETQAQTTRLSKFLTVKTYFDCPLPRDLQDHIAALCEEYHIDPAIIVAMCKKESTYNARAVGDGGNSLGLMQIQPRWHKDRMKRLGCTNLKDAYQNVTVGIDFLAELMGKYEDVEKALMAYNAGESGARKNWWKRGIYSNKYSRAVLEIAEELKEGAIHEIHR